MGPAALLLNLTFRVDREATAKSKDVPVNNSVPAKKEVVQSDLRKSQNNNVPEKTEKTRQKLSKPTAKENIPNANAVVAETPV